MATEKQIAANRANAKKNTGPKTAAGRAKSGRNAYRHGLSCQLQFDPVTSAKADAIAWTLIGEEPGEQKLESAAEFVGPVGAAADPFDAHRIAGEDWA
jgi:hypothetical protein